MPTPRRAHLMLVAFTAAAALLAAPARAATVAPDVRRPPAPAATDLAPAPDIRRDAAVMATEKVLPCVVNIATETVIEYHDWYDEIFRRFYGRRGPVRQEKSISVGSGVIIDEDGYVLTNFHVVQRASRVQVKLWDGREFEAERVVATRASDVALLKIRANAGEKFKAITLAADDDLLLGETVLALGNPFGLGGSVTKGILSSKARRPANANTPLGMEDWLQTDAAINPGNSGGPLVNLRGELIGLNVAVYREEDGERGLGVGFSIPVKQVSAALARFFTPEVADSLWLGLDVQGRAGKIIAAAVLPGSPADKAGLRQGDHILQANGKPADNLIQLNRAITADPAHTARFTILRDGQQQALTARMLPFLEMLQHRLGLTFDTDAKPGELPAPGLLLKAVGPKSPADKAGLKPGYILTALDGQAVSDIRTAGLLVAGKKSADPIQLNLVSPIRVGGRYLELREGSIQVQLR